MSRFVGMSWNIDARVMGSRPGSARWQIPSQAGASGLPKQGFPGT